jgi:predicted regulator of Ras-like GTPase activity (Roadblock/LC7/MglB family)
VKLDSPEIQSYIDQAPIITVGGDPTVFSDLAATLAEVRKLKGVLGYILRSNSTAVVDLAPNCPLHDYALLSSQVSGVGKSLGQTFKFADVESVLFEGTSVKLLCIGIGENRVGIFMDKSCTHSWIVKRILL